MSCFSEQALICKMIILCGNQAKFYRMKSHHHLSCCTHFPILVATMITIITAISSTPLKQKLSHISSPKTTSSGWRNSNEPHLPTRKDGVFHVFPDMGSPTVHVIFSIPRQLRRCKCLPKFGVSGRLFG